MYRNLKYTCRPTYQNAQLCRISLLNKVCAIGPAHATSITFEPMFFRDSIIYPHINDGIISCKNAML